MNVKYSIDSHDNVSVQDGLAELKLNAYTFQAIASLNFPIFKFNEGIVYGAGNSTLIITGDYDLN